MDYNPNYPNPTGPNLASANSALGVTYDGGYYSLSGSLSWGSSLPGLMDRDPDTSTPGYAGRVRATARGTFDFTPVPEVAAFGAFGVGLLGLVYIGRYVRLRRTMKLA